MTKVDRDIMQAKAFQAHLSEVLKVLGDATTSLKRLEEGTGDQEDAKNISVLIDEMLILVDSDPAQYFYE
jgi:hypothetical protein